MKYYVVERHYNQKGKLVIESRITGDTEDLSWAKKQMEYRFNQKMIDYRHEIKPGAIRFTAMKSEMDLEGGKYETEIIKVSTQLTAREILLAVNEKNKGDFYANLKSITNKAYVDEIITFTPDQSVIATTILDDDFPEKIKRTVSKPPFVLYYKGDLKLIDSRKYNRLTIGMGRDTCERLKSKAIDDIQKLPANIIIITSDPTIISACTEGPHRHKVILIKPCGLKNSDPRVKKYQEILIVQQGGLIITPFPNGFDAEPNNFLMKNKLMGCLGDNLLIISGTQHSAINLLVSSALEAGHEVMAYPTWPEYGNTINNSLIADGAILVENVEDIINTIKI